MIINGNYSDSHLRPHLNNRAVLEEENSKKAAFDLTFLLFTHTHFMRSDIADNLESRHNLLYSTYFVAFMEEAR